jgi:hypothetical protein
VTLTKLGIDLVLKPWTFCTMELIYNQRATVWYIHALIIGTIADACEFYSPTGNDLAETTIPQPITGTFNGEVYARTVPTRSYPVVSTDGATVPLRARI